MAIRIKIYWLQQYGRRLRLQSKLLGPMSLWYLLTIQIIGKPGDYTRAIISELDDDNMAGILINNMLLRWLRSAFVKKFYLGLLTDIIFHNIFIYYYSKSKPYNKRYMNMTYIKYHIILLILYWITMKLKMVGIFLKILLSIVPFL